MASGYQNDQFWSSKFRWAWGVWTPFPLMSHPGSLMRASSGNLRKYLVVLKVRFWMSCLVYSRTSISYLRTREWR